MKTGRLGGVAMAALAVVALGVTVATSRRALADASELVARGESDIVLAALASELTAEEVQPPNAETLRRLLAAHEAEGLRYVALVDREGRPVVEAGHATMPSGPARPGAATIEGRRVRALGIVPPPHPPALPHELPPIDAHRDRSPIDGSPRYVVVRRMNAGPLLAVELEPPMMVTLQRDHTRVGVVAAMASAILLAFAVAWSRSARRVAALEASAARAQRLVALGSMSSVMAHELRNPLASLKGHAQLLVEDLAEAEAAEGADAKRRAKAERVVAEAERLEVLTTSLLDFVRDGPIERAAVTPRALVDRALADLDGARVQVDLDRAPPAIDADLDRLGRALHNVVDNALKASDAEVSLVATHEDGQLRVSVRDRGPGLPPGEEARIFEPFVTTRTRGTGLGLAVARRIAEQHGGTLDGATHPDGGAVFDLRIPVQAS
ncbi:MAG: HAMP domain-containing histidine kinase [Labilithrix sp.]|nr:HAMP domain-containing histidine kinase [Labilithrix sp.]MCW5813313.1 HAMP domain-containing histidine kinase [Labilithrix sp.]